MNRAPEVGDEPCPTPAALAAFLCGELPPAAMDEIGAHVSSCRHCDAAVGRMDEATDESLKNLWHRLRGEGAPPTDSEYRRMVEAARALVPTQTFPPAAPRTVPPPARLGQYRLGARLGQGGVGAVYRAEHVRLKKAVAVKILSPAQTRDPRAVARFQLEMEVVGRLDHPNIVRATDAGEAEGVHFLVMELITGLNLAHLLYRYGPLPVAEACELVRQAAVGLQSAHEHGLVHRDVKPSNLMLSAGGQVKVLDLGLALLRDAASPEPGDLTGIGEVMGTAEYMAPEQWAETHAVDIRADVYSLGCTLYALLAGDPPFTSSGQRSFLRMMAAHQQQPVRPVADLRPDVPPALCALVRRMLAKSPNDRPATPGEVAAELARFAGGANLPALLAAADGAKTAPNRPRPGGATPPLTPTPLATEAGPPPRDPSRRRRRRLAAALALAVVATAVGVYAVAPAPVVPAGSGVAPDDDPPPDPKKARNLLAERHGDERLKRLWLPAVDSVLEHRRDKDALVIQSSRPALVRLGDAPNPAYKLQIGLRQVRWQGGIGVYFGGRERANPNEFVFQYLTVHHTRVGPSGYGLSRARGKFAPAPGAPPGIAPVEFATESIPPPDNEEKLLELEVKPNGLAVVRWNGAECPKLVDAAALAAAGTLFPDGGLTGEFGIYCNGAAVTVSTARYVPTE
jgi:serine/threonine protein kinase